MASDRFQGHSEQYFGDYRDYWWNADFLELMSTRLRWRSARRVLEVGVGAGHWTRAIAPHLSADATIVAVDRDPKWASADADWVAPLAASSGVAITVQQASADALPFADASFDFVTCQTVLIHVVDVRACITEMLRVLQPGGLLLCVEPDNFGIFCAKSSISDDFSIDDSVAAFRFALTQARGNKLLGLGDPSCGGLLPGLFAAAGLRDLDVRLSDKAMPVFPSYDTAEQRALLGDLKTIMASAPDWSRDEAQRGYLAGGGDPLDFEGHWRRELASRESYLQALDEHRYHDAGGTLMYLVSGRR